MKSASDPNGDQLQGKVVFNDATVSLSLVAPGGQRLERTAIVDTGFCEALMLPPLLFEKVRRGVVIQRETTLADESVTQHDAATVRVILCGREKEVWAGSLGREILIGMELLAGYRLSIDCVEGGPVTIGPLSL